MTRYERARLRLYTRQLAYRYLRVKRLPPGVPAICRAYADSFRTYPMATHYEVAGTDPFLGLARQLRPYRKHFLCV